MNATTAQARRLCQRTGQTLPPELEKPVKTQGAVKHPDGTDLERAFDSAWQQFGIAGVTWEREHRVYAPQRRSPFRVDRYAADYLLAVEIEGEGHSRYYNFRRDMLKYNLLASRGILLFRCTGEMLTNDPAGFVALVCAAIARRQGETEEERSK